MHTTRAYCRVYGYRIEGAPDEKVSLEADTEEQTPTTSSVPSKDPKFCLQACPLEVLLAIYKFVDWSNKGNLRLTCHRLARAGLADMLGDME